MRKTLFKIKILKWQDASSGPKKSFKKTMIWNNIISDGAIISLPVSARYTFIALLLISGDTSNDTLTITERQVNELSTSRERAENVLDRLQSLQLLSYEKIPLKEGRKEVTGVAKKNELVVKNSEALTQPVAKIAPVSKEVSNFKPTSAQELVGIFDNQTTATWADLYNNDTEYLKREIIKAFEYYRSNPGAPRSARGWKRAISSWLERGWRNHTRGMSSQENQSTFTGIARD